MSRPHVGVRGAVLLAAVGLVAAGVPALTANAVTPAASSGSPVATATTDQSRPAHLANPTIPQRYLDQKITWQACPFDAVLKQRIPGIKDSLCAQVKVPMDWQNPDAHPDIELSVAYTKASGVSKGLLVSNPGGPGGSGRTLTHALALGKPQMAAEYDLLSFDPRGFGTSTNVKCNTTQAELDALPTTTDYRRLDGKTFAVQEAEARLVAKACSSSELAPFVNTQQTVYDMDFLRALKGGEKLNYVGFSYGTWLGAWYADTYPTRTGRFILDSNMDWTGTMKDAFDLQARGFQRRRDAMLFPWIARNAATYKLGTTATAVKARYEKIRAAVVANAAKGHTDPGAAEMDHAVAQLLYSNSSFPAAAERILAYETYSQNPEGGLPPESAGLAPDPLVTEKSKNLTPSMAIAAARENRSAAPTDVVDLGAMGTVVRCNDSVWPTSKAPYVSKWLLETATHPFLGYNYGINTCAYWPFHRDADRKIDLAGAPKILLFQSEGDPATEYSGGMKAHLRTLAGTRLVKVDDEGQHGLWDTLGTACVESTGDAFLFGGNLPSRDVTCGTKPLLGDKRVYPLAGDVVGGNHEVPAEAGAKRSATAVIRNAQSLG